MKSSIELRQEQHEKEMIDSYAYFMKMYFHENKAFHFPTTIVAHDDTRYVLEYEGRKLVLEFDPSWSQLVYTVNGKGPFAHTTYESIWDDLRDVMAYEDRERGALAARLSAFYKDFDFYDYMDSLDGTQTEEDVAHSLAEQLADSNSVSSILVFLNNIKEEDNLLDEQQAQVLDSLISDVEAVQAYLYVSFDGKLNVAHMRSAETLQLASSKDEPEKVQEI